MRPALVALVAAAFLSSARSGYADDTPDPKLVTIKHLTGPLWVVEDDYLFRENSVLYVGQSTATLIGTGWTPQVAALIAAAVGRVTSKPVREVVDTDYNPERAGGNGYWKDAGAAVIATKRTDELLRSDWTKVGDFTRAAIPAYPHVPLSLPTRVYPGDFSLQDGQVRAFWLGPTHTPDDIFVYFPSQRVLYAGNILKEHVGNLAFAADIHTYEATLERLKAMRLPLRYVVSGHWEPVHGPELIDTYIGFLRGQRTSGIAGPKGGSLATSRSAGTR